MAIGSSAILIGGGIWNIWNIFSVILMLKCGAPMPNALSLASLFVLFQQNEQEGLYKITEYEF